MINEIWKSVMGYHGYEVSNLGNVRSYKRRGSTDIHDKPVLLKSIPVKTHCKVYLCYRLRIQGTTKTEYIHRLVAKAFHENHENKPQVNHIDNNPLNNNSNNLEWCTNSENQRHRFKSQHPTVGRDRNSFRVCFTTIEGKRT
jgi:hypothetical protein